MSDAEFWKSEYEKLVEQWRTQSQSSGPRLFEKMVDAKLRGEDQSAEIARLRQRILALEAALRDMYSCPPDKRHIAEMNARALLHDSTEESEQ